MTLFEELTKTFPDIPFQAQYPLAAKTYFKIGGPAEVYAQVADREQFASLVQYCRRQEIKLTILGGGSNVVIADAGLPGLVCSFTGSVVSATPATSGKILLSAESGIKTALLVAQSASHGATGLEYFLGVPGTLGGAIYNNSHYMQQLIGTYVHQVEIIQQDGSRSWLSQEECEFGYDTSRFHHTHDCILSVEFLLAAGDTTASQAKIKEATEYRAKTQPLGTASSGCIFRNTPNTPVLRERFPQFAEKEFVPAGFLIDQAGLKGTRLGALEVSQKHAAWIINHGGGTQAEVKTLIAKIKATVTAEFGVELQEEVFYLE